MVIIVSLEACRVGKHVLYTHMYVGVREYMHIAYIYMHMYTQHVYTNPHNIINTAHKIKYPIRTVKF